MELTPLVIEQASSSFAANTSSMPSEAIETSPLKTARDDQKRVERRETSRAWGPSGIKPFLQMFKKVESLAADGKTS